MVTFVDETMFLKVYRYLSIVTEKHVLSDGIARNVQQIAGSSTTVVFLHEALGSIAQWKNFPQAFCAKFGFSGVVYERAGYGGSEGSVLPRKDNFLENTAVEELNEMLNVLGLDTPVILYGHSDGGSIALAFAAKFPHRVQMVISEAAHVLVEQETMDGVQKVGEIYQERLREKLMKYHGQRTDDVFNAWHDVWLRPSFRNWNIALSLKSIVCPVLAIQGAKDEYGTKQQLEEIASFVTNATTLEIPDAGHHPHVTHREGVLNICNEFMQHTKSQNEQHFRRLQDVYHTAPVNVEMKPKLEVSWGAATSVMVAEKKYFHAGKGLHGALYFKMLDDTAYFACQSVEREYFLLTAEFTTRFFKPVTGGELVCESKIDHIDGKKYRASAKLFWNDELAGEGSGLFLRSRIRLDDLEAYGGKQNI